MVPVRYSVAHREDETHDSVTLRLAPIAERLARPRPGQFTMLYARGIGEVPISVSGDPASTDGSLVHTIRDVGAVSGALRRLAPGAFVGVRGPFGTGWEPERAAGRDMVIVAGGIGLAPLRPVLLRALADRGSFRRVVLIAGARTPDEFLYREQLAAWSARTDVDVELTVDAPAENWHGSVGFVTEPLARLAVDPARTTAFLCGPEPMMHYCAKTLLGKGLPARDIRVSLERNMRCGIGLCGHCQLGPILVCRDGPVLDYAAAAPLLAVPEL